MGKLRFSVAKASAAESVGNQGTFLTPAFSFPSCLLPPPSPLKSTSDQDLTPSMSQQQPALKRSRTKTADEAAQDAVVSTLSFSSLHAAANPFLGRTPPTSTSRAPCNRSFQCNQTRPSPSLASPSETLPNVAQSSPPQRSRATMMFPTLKTSWTPSF